VKVLVDTCVWYLALRRRRGRLGAEEARRVDALRRLIEQGRVVMCGPIRQELLSGVREELSFERLRQRLRPFEDEPLVAEDYEEAARCRNRCRAAGVAGSAVDFLLCAVALRRKVEIFTTDGDFPRYAAHLPIRLFAPEE
jgi:hypothetical protein